MLIFIKKRTQGRYKRTELDGCSATQTIRRTTPNNMPKHHRTATALAFTLFLSVVSPIGFDRVRRVVAEDIQTQLEHGGPLNATPPSLIRSIYCKKVKNPLLS